MTESTAQPRHFYADPAINIKYESERNKCHGCRHEIVVALVGKMVRGCNKGKKHGNGCTLKGKA